MHNEHNGRRPEDLDEWLRDLMCPLSDPHRNAPIPIPDRDRLLMILALAKETSSPVDEETAWEYMGSAPQGVRALVEGLRGRGRPYTRMMRVVVGWLLAEGWPMPRPNPRILGEPVEDSRYDEAVADVMIWHSREGLDLSMPKIAALARDISAIRFAVESAAPELMPPGRSFDQKKGNSFDVTDDAGLKYRIWSQGPVGAQVELLKPAQPWGASMKYDRSTIAKMLRESASGDRSHEAGAELIIHLFDGVLLDGPWVQEFGSGSETWLELTKRGVVNAPLSEEEEVALDFAVSLTSSQGVTIHQRLESLGDEALTAVFRALAHASGREIYRTVFQSDRGAEAITGQDDYSDDIGQ